MIPKVLIVDDEPDVLTLALHLLESEDWKVITARSGSDVLDPARTGLPDVILMDLTLPDIDGLAVCEILRRQPSTRDIPVLMMTAMASEGHRRCSVTRRQW